MSLRNAISRFSRLPVLIAFAALCILAIIIPSLALRSSVAEAAPQIHLNAFGGALVVSPTSLSNCMHCSVTVSNTRTAKSLVWSATSQGVPGIIISPHAGTLSPQGQKNVTITIPASTTCPASATITFSAPLANSVSVSWKCSATPTPSPSPSPDPSPSPTPSPTASLSTVTPSASPTPSTAPTSTATVSSVGRTGQQNNGNPPTGNGGGSGNSALSILFTFAGLLLGALAFLLYLIPPAHSSLRARLLSLVMPVSLARRIERDH